MPLNKAVNVDASTATFGSYNPSVNTGGTLDLYGYTSALRSNITISGGGNISTTGGYLSWSYRFIVMQAGTRGSSFATNGYFDIFMPPVGTSVPGIGGAADRFVESGGILLNGWESLFYILPIGASNSTVNANFRVVAYTTHNFDIPPNWVRICTKNGDTGIYHMSNGANIATGDISYSGIQTLYATQYSLPLRDASGNLWSSGIAQHDATATMNPYTAIKSSGTRANDLAPNTYAWGLFSEFKNTSFAGVTSGSYGGLLTYAVWNGTTVSTGDPSYQLLFHPQGVNSTLPPVLKIRAGIDTTWGSWSTILHSSNVTSFAKAPAGDLLAAADWNTYTAQGMYRYGRTDWTGVTNNPSASAYTYGTLDIISSGTNAVTQVYYTHSATNGMYFRSKWNASDWQSWIQVLDNSASNQVKSGSLTATAFIPSGSTVPTNGMYLSAANTLNFATNTTNRLSIDSAGAAAFTGTIAATGLAGSLLTSTVGSTLATTATAGTATVPARADHVHPTTGLAIDGNLVASTNFNTAVRSGIYRFNNTNTNGPGVDWGQMLVMRGANTDTITQLVGDYLTGNIYTRSGNPTDVGGSGSWTSWFRLVRTADNLSAFSATTSAQLAGVISDETGSGALVFGTSPSFTTSITVAGASLGGTATNETIVSNVYSTTSNADYIRTKWRRITTGADWQTAQAKIQRVVDVTDMGYIGFGGTSTYDVRIGSGTTDIAVFAPTAITLSQPTTANSFIPSSSTVPTNGMYLPATNTVGISSNSTQRMTFDANGSLKFFGQVAESATTSATAATGTINYDVMSNKNVLYYTSNASANWTLNIRGNASTSLNTLMDTGQSLTVVFMATNGATAYYQTGFQIDGTAVTPKWQGGTTPSSGNANSIDVYVINIIKTASATYTVFESQTRFA